MADTQNIPLVVDLDGTLIRTDMMWESLARRLRRNPFAIFQILFWWMRGRALLKQKLAARVQVDPDSLPYHEKFLVWLREEKNAGRKLILATASDLKMAAPIAAHVGVFDEVLASDGKTNLRSKNKLRALTEKFGERGFDYAGNSTADFAVWRGSRQAVVVNASHRVLQEASKCTALGPTFCDDYSPLAIAISVSKELLWRSGYLVAAIAGLFLTLSFPKFSLAGFAWVAPAIILLAARGKRGADTFRTGYVAGLVFWLTSLYWLLYMPVAGFPILAWVALSVYVALFIGVWSWFVSRLHFSGYSWLARLRWTIVGAAAWVALEWLRGWLLSGFPWSFLGASQYKLVPLLQIAAVTGVYGVSFIVVWLSLGIYSAGEMIYRNPSKRHVWQAEIALPIITVMLLFAGGLFWINHSKRAATDSEHPPFLRATLVQPSVPQTLIWSPSEDEKRFARLLVVSEQAMTNHPHLLIWPESAVPMFDGVYDIISRFAQTNHLAIIFNGDDTDFGPAATNYYNAAFIINPGGFCTGVYHKQKLVIFGEYIPLTHWLPFLKWFTPIQDGWTAGDKPALFVLNQWGKRSRKPLIQVDNSAPEIPPHPPVKISPLICFEDVFPGIARAAAASRPDFLVNLTNDGWFSDSAEQWQHLANAVFRAVENDVPLVICANNGITCWVDSHGRVRQVLRNASGNVYVPGVLNIKIPIRPTGEAPAPTFYQRHGNWFAWSCAGIALIGLFPKRKKRLMEPKISA